ncbi:MAG: hypothetical protein H6Q31_2962, partial [Bacteroidetes bacterium]|nr:hypothetical protein [Bacteroidota bacterium]
MPSDVDDIRSLLLSGRDQVRMAHRAGADGWETCTRLSQGMDAVLRLAFSRGIPRSLQSRSA